jgi:hypothetical protein
MDTLKEFLAACRDTPGKVFPWKSAQRDARDLLKLDSKEELLAFISNGGLERVEKEHVKIWEKNPHPEKPKTIHSYKFFTNALPLYIAIFFNEELGTWNIKSFHEPKDKNPTLADQLKQLLDQKQLEEKS